MADKQKDGDQEKAAPKAKAKPNLLENKAIVLGVIVIAQAAVAIGLTQFFIVPKLGVGTADAGGHAVAEAHGDKAPGDAKHDKKEEKKEGGGHGAEGAGATTLADLQEIVVTLAGDSARPRYLRLGISLEMSDAAYVAEVEARRPQLRDAVIMALSDKTAAMLGTPDGKKRLREEIHRRAEEKLPEGALLNVYFSDLVVQ
ncbi:MAG: flagellar basal body-associated FliL family protein [bacterium]|nr:flagellar basal body-associated FliL family protein [bacterium]